MKRATEILKSEHRSIAAVLNGLKELARLAQDPDIKPDFRALRAMVRYIDEYPERLHHPKEDKYLFARLLARAPHTLPLVRRLTQQHEDGARMIRELERALLFLEEGWPQGRLEFRQAVDDYARFHWDHMRLEEQELMPLAERELTQEDWNWVDDAFAGNFDPIADLREKDFAQLFTRIVNLAPAPVGLGEPWKNSSG
jgi:hemerythrin-like domain-containing protein